MDQSFLSSLEVQVHLEVQVLLMGPFLLWVPMAQVNQLDPEYQMGPDFLVGLGFQWDPYLLVFLEFQAVLLSQNCLVDQVHQGHLKDLEVLVDHFDREDRPFQVYHQHLSLPEVHAVLVVPVCLEFLAVRVYLFRL